MKAGLARQGRASGRFGSEARILLGFEETEETKSPGD